MEKTLDYVIARFQEAGSFRGLSTAFGAMFVYTLAYPNFHLGAITNEQLQLISFSAVVVCSLAGLFIKDTPTKP